MSRPMTARGRTLSYIDEVDRRKELLASMFKQRNELVDRVVHGEDVYDQLYAAEEEIIQHATSEFEIKSLFGW